MEDKLRQITMIQALIIGVVFGAIYYLLIFKASDAGALIKSYDEEIAQLEKEILGLDKSVKEVVELEEKSKVLSEELLRQQKYAPKNINTGEILKQLSEEARQSGLSIDSISDDVTWEEAGALEYAEVSLKLKGDFHQVMTMLSSLSRLKSLIIVNELVLQREDDKTDDSRSIRQISILDLRLRIYKEAEVEEVVEDGEGFDEENFE